MELKATDLLSYLLWQNKQFSKDEYYKISIYILLKFINTQIIQIILLIKWAVIQV